ncbi:hypothetical protein FRC06_009230 [Ceratobasidium sp. 370]|nr:hypothetical protein FRC06_009230 [Ceratobasidium sp. 370]
MDVTMQPPPYSLEDRKTATYAEVAKSTGNDPGFKEVLRSFREFMNSQETMKLSQNQLELFRGLSVLVLETSVNSIKSGGDVSAILSDSARILDTVSSSLKTKTQINVVIEDPSELRDLESNIREGFDGLEAQLRKLVQASELESTMYREELIKAQQRDRAKIEELEAIVKQAPQSGGNLDAIIQKSMEDNLKIIGDHTVGQKQVDARRALAILTGLTGKSLPPSTLLGRDFVTIGQHAIHQGTNYDVFLGEYFTGEKIAIKVLRHRVDEVTAKKTHERFGRQALNWSTLRHDAILPFYGIGVTQSPVVSGEFQLYMVSPYLQNQDAKRYLKKYSQAPKKARLQMVLDVARGLYHMHEAAQLPEPGHGIVHSGLNIYNVLIKDSGRAVMRDLQESFTGDNSEYRYMAPEMMLDEPHITYGTDIWSWAMTALEILTDVPAFGERTKGPRIITLLTALQRPKRADHPKIEEYSNPDELWDIFEKCWDQDPAARPSADALVTRLRPLVVQEFGKKTQGGTQAPEPQPYGRGPTVAVAGRRDPSVQAGSSPAAPAPEQIELGRRTDSIAQGEPLAGTQGGPEKQELGKANPPVVPGPPPKP